MKDFSTGSGFWGLEKVVYVTTYIDAYIYMCGRKGSTFSGH